LVYQFYNHTYNEEKRDWLVLANLLRVAAYTAKDLTKEGNVEINKLWTKLTDTLKPSNIIREIKTDRKRPKKKVEAKNVNEAVMSEDDDIVKTFVGSIGAQVQTPLKITKKRVR